MKKGRILFRGNFGEYFLLSLCLLILSVITFGIMLPYYFYWNAKYFVSNLDIEIED